MRNIVYISFSALPSHNPSSLQIVKTCEAFAALGHNVELIVPNTGFLDKSANQFYGIKNAFKITRVNYIKYFPRGPLYYLYAFSCFFLVLKKKNILIISRSFFIIFLLIFIKKNIILEVHHDLTNEGRLVKFLIKHFNFLNSKYIEKIIAISNSLKILYSEKFFVNKNKIFVLPSGSSINNNFNNQIKVNKNLNIGYFGSLSNSKGIDTVIKLSIIDKDNNYFIYGGSKKEILKIKRKIKNKNLILSDYVPFKEIYSKMMNMDVMLIPYKSVVKSSGEVDNIANYTSPLKLFDYLASGKIIISSNLKVLKEVLKNKNAFFVKNFENVYSWKKEICKIRNLKERKIIYFKNNYLYSKIFTHRLRVKKYL